MRKLYWAITSDASDEYARELFEKRYGCLPEEIKRYPKCALLLGPIPKGGKDE